MASIINASNTSGLKLTSDTSGALSVQTNNITAMTIDSSQNVAIVGNTTSTGQIRSSASNVAPVFADPAGNTIAPRAWLYATWNGSAMTIQSSFNIASLTRTAAGYYTIVMTNALTDANYAVIATATANATYLSYIAYVNAEAVTQTNTTFYLTTLNVSAYADPAALNVVVYR
jgi:hypothetical protein